MNNEKYHEHDEGAQTILGGETGGETGQAEYSGDAGAQGQDFGRFQVPEGFDYSEDKVSEFTNLARELKLNHTQAQKLVDLHTRQWMDHDRLITQQQEEWEQKTRNHPEFGGQRFEQSLADAMRFVNRFGGDDLKHTLNETGVGSHPVIFAAFAKAGRLLGEDRMVGGAARTPQGGTFAELANTMYPDMR